MIKVSEWTGKEGIGKMRVKRKGWRWEGRIMKRRDKSKNEKYEERKEKR